MNKHFSLGFILFIVVLSALAGGIGSQLLLGYGHVNGSAIHSKIIQAEEFQVVDKSGKILGSYTFTQTPLKSGEFLAKIIVGRDSKDENFYESCLRGSLQFFGGREWSRFCD